MLQYVGKALGKGTFGQVKLGTHILTGEKVICLNNITPTYINLISIGCSKNS